MLVFYRGSNSVVFLSEFKGKKLAVGPPRSGTRLLALALLQLNGIETNGPTQFVDSDSEQAAKDLLAGTLDALFLTGDSASPKLMRQLLSEPGIRMFDFTQADAYTRRLGYLNKLELPKGGLDIGKNIPDHDVYVVGPTIELLARPDLHPALCDLLLEAAREVHGGSSLLRRKGEFPAPLEHEFPMSAEALRYYKSGKSFLYRSLPFWMASMMNRVLLVFVPVFVVLIPGLRLIPTLFRLRTKLRLYRWYRMLLLLERDLLGDISHERRKDLLARLDDIEEGVSKMKVPASFADQFYGLRGHIGFVRERLLSTGKPA
jgi:hypothetical protein